MAPPAQVTGPWQQPVPPNPPIGRPQRRTARAGVVLTALAVASLTLLLLSAVMPWYLHSYDRELGNGSTQHYLTHKTVTTQDTVDDFGYEEDLLFASARTVWQLTTALVIMAAAALILLILLGAVAALRKMGKALPSIVAFVVMVLLLLIPVYVAVALPLALAEDTKGGWGNLSDEPKPTTSFVGTNEEPDGSVQWGPQSGYLLTIANAALGTVALAFARRIPRPLPPGAHQIQTFTAQGPLTAMAQQEQERQHARSGRTGPIRPMGSAARLGGPLDEIPAAAGAPAPHGQLLSPVHEPPVPAAGSAAVATAQAPVRVVAAPAPPTQAPQPRLPQAGTGVLGGPPSPTGQSQWSGAPPAGWSGAPAVVPSPGPGAGGPSPPPPPPSAAPPSGPAQLRTVGAPVPPQLPPPPPLPVPPTQRRPPTP